MLFNNCKSFIKNFTISKIKCMSVTVFGMEFRNHNKVELGGLSSTSYCFTINSYMVVLS